MASESRFTGAAVWLGIVLLVAAIGVPAYLLTRPPAPLKDDGIALADLDVVCNGRVDFDGTVISLEPMQAGRLLEILVKEGANVKAGDPILRIDDSPYRGAVREAAAAVKAVQAEIEAADVRVKQHPDTVKLQEKKLAATKADVAALDKQLEQLREKSKLSSLVTKTDVEAFEAKFQAAKLMVESDQLQLDQLRKLDTTLELKGLAAKREAAEVAKERAEKAVADCVLKAPIDGTILRLQTGVGATLAPGMPMPTILFAPSSQMIVRAEVDQAAMGRVREGMKATIRDDARPDSPVWTGRVRTIAGWVAQKRSILLEPGEMNDVRTTEVVIELDKSSDILRIGQRMIIRITK